MVRFIVGRIAYAALVLFGVTTLVFALIHLSGDPLAGLVPPGSSPAQLARLRVAYGLDRPLPAQYVAFLGRAIHGDFGESWRQGRPALTVVLERLPATLALAASATALASVVGVGLGVAAGWRASAATDLAARSLALAGQAIPGFWLGTILIVIFAVRLQWLPSSGLEGPASLVLPAATLAAFPAAALTRLVRAGLRETRRADWLRTARAKGLPEEAVLFGHALRNAMLPALAFVGVQAGYLLGGAVVVESVFAYPGVGLLALNAVADRDLPIVEAFVAVVAVAIVAVEILVEVAARLLDPRLRAETALAAGASA
ncbi:MAG TPA: ABC transporter permease [Thermomicrobiales bacterium]|nr:ABC transporter permease [Thermomicrobiales bacterium]